MRPSGVSVRGLPRLSRCVCGVLRGARRERCKRCGSCRVLTCVCASRSEGSAPAWGLRAVSAGVNSEAMCVPVLGFEGSDPCCV